MQCLVRTIEGLKLMPLLFGFGVQPRVLDGHCRALGECNEYPLLIARQRARLTIVDAEHPKDFIVDLDGHVQQGTDAFGPGDTVGDTRVVGHILHRDWLTSECDAGRDALAWRMR